MEVINELKKAEIKLSFFSISKYHLKVLPSVALKDNTNNENIGIIKIPIKPSNMYFIGFIQLLWILLLWQNKILNSTT